MVTLHGLKLLVVGPITYGQSTSCITNIREGFAIKGARSGREAHADEEELGADVTRAGRGRPVRPAAFPSRFRTA